jgi:hypothetical protein
MFKWTICDPSVVHPIDKGLIPKESVLQAFSDFPWTDMLAKIRTGDSKGFQFSPSVEFTNVDDGCSLTATMIEDKKETVFSLFFEDATDDSDDAEFLGQSLDITVDILEEFVAGQYDRLRARVSCPGEPTPDSGGGKAADSDDAFQFQFKLEPPEAELILQRLEKENIRFQVETDYPGHWGNRGYLKSSAVGLYVHRDDEDRFRKISEEFFKV